MLVALASLVSGCGGSGSDAQASDPSRRQPLAADVGDLEIRANGVDRFATCPPPGELGQNWIPKPFAWTPPSPSPDAGAPLPIDGDYIARTQDRSPTELAVDATHRDFRSCYRKSLVHYPTQDGRVAIVLRVGPSGKVAKVEEYAACELAPEAIACMKDVASHLHFPPPAGGSDIVTIPATFTSRDGVRRTVATSNDAFTASAYVTIESSRPAFHACEEQARRDHKPVQATGTFTLDLAPDGRVLRTHIDPWSGEQSLLLCTARVFETVHFTAPPGGVGTVLARLNFNPRQGTR